MTTSKLIKDLQRGDIYHNVNWDYPQCGGTTVKKGNKYITIEQLSNMQGQNNATYRTLIADWADSTVDEMLEKWSDFSGGYEHYFEQMSRSTVY